MDSRAGEWTVATFGAALVAMAAALGVAATATAATTGSGCDGAQDQARSLSVADAEDAIRCVVNAERRDAGLRAWGDDRRLARAARRHAGDMVERDFFAHESPGGSDVLDRVRRTGWARGRSRWSVGEVLAWGTGRYTTPRAIVTSWLESRSHRAVLLDRDFEHAGVGVTRGKPGRKARNALTVALVAGTDR